MVTLTFLAAEIKKRRPSYPLWTELRHIDQNLFKMNLFLLN